MSAVCATPGCDRFRESGLSFCPDHAPKAERRPFSEASGCGLALVVLIAALALGVVWSIVRAVL